MPIRVIGSSWEFKSRLDELMIERMSENDQIATRYLSDETFRSLALPILAQEPYSRTYRRKVRMRPHRNN